MSGEQIVFKRGIYDKDKFLNSSNSAIPHNKGHFYLATANTYSSHLIYDDGVNFLEVIPSLLGEANGGTGVDLTTIAPYSTLIQNSTSTQVEGVESIKGAYYSTANGAKPQFGILPYNLGGTGNTDYTTNTLIFADSNKKLKSIAKTTVSSNQISITDTDNTTTTAFNVRNKDGGVSLRAATFTGLYDQVNSSWIINKTQATDAEAAEVRVPAWSSTGNGKKIIYFNSNGKPVVSSTTVGSASRPVYMSSGTITAITTLSTAYGGTGNTTFNANRVIYSETATKLSSTGHYSSSTKMAINHTSDPSYNFYVNGTTGFYGDVTIAQNYSFLRNGKSSSWWNGRDNAMIRQVSSNGYSPILSMKTTNGSWDMGNYNADSWHDILLLNYKSDTSYANAGNDNTVVHALKLFKDGSLELGGGVKYSNSDKSFFPLISEKNKAGSIGTATRIWSNGYFNRLNIRGTTIDGDAMNASSANPGLCFSSAYDGSQPVYLLYTDYNNYREPAGLKIVGGTSSTPAWLEIEGKLVLNNNIVYTNNGNEKEVIKFISGESTGSGIIIGSGGPVFIGGGESASSVKNHLFNLNQASGETEYTFITSDNGIKLYTDCNSAVGQYAELRGPDTASPTFYFPNTGGTLLTQPTRGTAVGNTNRPVYIAATGRATICNTPSSGAWWQGVPFVSAGGVIEIGKYIDFHNVSTNTNDYSTRIDCASNTANVLTLPSGTGTLAILSKGTTNYWGLRSPANTDEWIRTTSQGLIPHTPGGPDGDANGDNSSLGTSTWYFKNSYIGHMRTSEILYENGSYNEKSMIRFKTGNNDGATLSMGGGGPVVIGSGESSEALITNLSISGTGEESTYIAADSNIYFYTGCNTIANKVGVVLNASRVFYPDKNNTGHLGGTSYNWSGVHARNLTSNDNLNITSAGTIYINAGSSNSTIFRKGEVEQGRFDNGGTFNLSGGGSYNAKLHAPDTATGNFYFPNTGGTFVTHATRGTAVGSASLPVYIAATGRATACTGSSVFSALSWTGGTTAGPVLNATIAGYARTATIPSASASASGVVTTGTQSFAGTKTFTANTTHYNTLLESTNSIAYWGNPTLNMGLSASSLYIAGADNSGAVDLGSSSRRWKGLYIAGNVNSGGYDVIRNYNNGNITVNAASKILYLGYTTTTQIISSQNHSISGYLKVNSTAVAEYALDVNGTIKFTKRLIGASGTDSVYGSSLPATSNSTTGQIFFKIG